jgi:hypothetical protein
MDSLADGFTGGEAIAGLAAVAEGPHHMQAAVRNAVAQLRDTFAEGVAYGAGDLLEDSIQELVQDPSSNEVSIAAAAVLGREVWVYSSGACHAFLTGGGRSRDCFSSEELSGSNVLRRSLEPGQALVLVTEGLGRLVLSKAADEFSSRCRMPLQTCLSEMVEETRIRFRKTGGSAAAVRYCRVARKFPPVSARRVVYALLAVLAALTIVFLLCHGGHEGSAPASLEPSDTCETVMPLD